MSTLSGKRGKLIHSGSRLHTRLSVEGLSRSWSRQMCIFYHFDDFTSHKFAYSETHFRALVALCFLHAMPLYEYVRVAFKLNLPHVDFFLNVFEMIDEADILLQRR